MLEDYITTSLKKKPILLMTHIVMGYPSFDDSYEIVKNMVEAGVDIMELQIPFSEPIADGPVILNANQKALERNVSVAECKSFAQTVARDFDIPFLYMSYFNIPFKRGLEDFVTEMKQDGLVGSIIPDLPPEEGQDYIDLMKQNKLDPIFLYSPNTSEARMKYLSDQGTGFIYCVSRTGVTGKNTDFSADLTTYLQRCRQATALPLAVGFGVKEKADVDFLTGKVDIAIIGSQTIRLVDQQGPGAVTDFIKNIR